MWCTQHQASDLKSQTRTKQRLDTSIFYYKEEKRTKKKDILDVVNYSHYYVLIMHPNNSFFSR